jgi:hypothetical protein
MAARLARLFLGLDGLLLSLPIWFSYGFLLSESLCSV